MIDPQKEIPLEVAQQHAASDPGLQSMIRKGMPLTRDMWLAHAWGSTLPEPWTAEHEMEVPEPFRDPSAVTGGRPLRDIPQ